MVRGAGRCGIVGSGEGYIREVRPARDESRRNWITMLDGLKKIVETTV